MITDHRIISGVFGRAKSATTNNNININNNNNNNKESSHDSTTKKAESNHNNAQLSFTSLSKLILSPLIEKGEEEEEEDGALITCSYDSQTCSGLVSLPNKLKVISFGDDVGFQQKVENKSIYYFGIADGVSANRLRGYDASLFPTALLMTCSNLIATTQNHNYLVDTAFNTNLTVPFMYSSSYPSSSSSSSSPPIDDSSLSTSPTTSNESSPTPSISTTSESTGVFVDEETTTPECLHLNDILTVAHSKVQNQKIYGSSTACLVNLRFIEGSISLINNKSDNNQPVIALLSTCYIGDSGYIIIRDKQCIFKSGAQSHRYNAPFQLGCTPPELMDHDLYRDRYSFLIIHF
jgi:hypothetical protein